MTDLCNELAMSNMTTWLETEALKSGTANQRERWAAQLLPEDEILQLARAELYKGLDLNRWHNHDQRKYLRASLRHTKSYGGVLCSQPAPEYEVAELAELGEHEWNNLKKLQAHVDGINDHPWLFRANQKATLSTFTLWATCPHCEAEICRSGAKVSIPWAGRTLVREYVL